MEINGKPRLACMTRMNMFEEGETITVTPLRAFPVIRDLVTDVSFNFKKAMEIPAFEPPADLKPGEFRMQQVAMSSAVKNFESALSASFVRTLAMSSVITRRIKNPSRVRVSSSESQN